MSGRIMKKILNPITEADFAKCQVVTDIFKYTEGLGKEFTGEPASKVLAAMRNYLKGKYPEYIESFGENGPTEFENKFRFVETYKYRNALVNIYMDDYGQQYYFYYKDNIYCCGSYCDYMPVVECVIDFDLDTICAYVERNPKFAGAYCKFANKAHTKVSITYRGDVVKTYKVEKGDQAAIARIREEGEQIIEGLTVDKHD